MMWTSPTLKGAVMMSCTTGAGVQLGVVELAREPDESRPRNQDVLAERTPTPVAEELHAGVARQRGRASAR